MTTSKAPALTPANGQGAIEAQLIQVPDGTQIASTASLDFQYVAH